jgi:ABC-type transport system substrate-binding protein
MITNLSAIRALQEHRTRAHLIPADLDHTRPYPQIQSARRKPVDRSRVLALAGLLFGIVILVVMVTACGNAVAPTTAAAPAAEATTTAPITTAAPNTTTTTEPATTTSAAPDAAPPELAGRWQKESQGERVILSLTGTSYSFIIIGQGEASAGRISVEGNQVKFYEGNTAPGDGFYEWKVDGDTLTFVELDPPDEHGGRRGGLVDIIWTRL